jgi:hypothetical protein
MWPHADDELLTPDERSRGVAALFATGLRRLRNHAVQAADSAQLVYVLPTEISSESGPNCLELPTKPRLSVHTG